MGNKSNNLENIKIYLGVLRDLLDSNKPLNKKKLHKIQSENKLSEDDINIINEKSENDFLSAKEEYLKGNWDKSLLYIDESIYKNPINYIYLEFKLKILTELINIIGINEELSYKKNTTLKSLKNLNLFRYLKTQVFNSKKWFLLLLLLLIPILIFFINLSPTNKITSINKTEEMILQPGEILIEKNIVRHKSQINLDIIKSYLSGNENSFTYILQFNISSNIDNILLIQGNISWYSNKNEVIFVEDFTSIKNREYYINEKIPFSIIKNSRRDSPNIKKVVINITKIISQEGKEREKKQDIDIQYPINESWDVNINELNYQITSGVTKDYLTLNIQINNNDLRDINKMLGNIEWLEEFDVISSSSDINFIKSSDIPLLSKSSRYIQKTIEIPKVTNNYRINIKEIE